MTRLQNFLASQQRNSWINESGYTTYFRKSFRYIPEADDPVPCLDIANIAATESRRSKGFFKDFIKTVETDTVRSNKFDTVFIENLLDPRFEEYLKREHGFKRLPGNSTDVVCLYKRIG